MSSEESSTTPPLVRTEGVYIYQVPGESAEAWIARIHTAMAMPPLSPQPSPVPAPAAPEGIPAMAFAPVLFAPEPDDGDSQPLVLSQASTATTLHYQHSQDTVTGPEYYGSQPPLNASYSG